VVLRAHEYQLRRSQMNMEDTSFKAQLYNGNLNHHSHSIVSIKEIYMYFLSKPCTILITECAVGVQTYKYNIYLLQHHICLVDVSI
jgi:hypothetical protein